MPRMMIRLVLVHETSAAAPAVRHGRTHIWGLRPAILTSCLAKGGREGDREEQLGRRQLSWDADSTMRCDGLFFLAIPSTYFVLVAGLVAAVPTLFRLHLGGMGRRAD